jgi:preprotein translocase subunit SecG
MLYGFLATLFVFCSILLIIIVLLQRGKGGMGIGAIGGSQQQLFGATGGQDLFQKITWVLGAIILIGSLSLAYYRTHYFTPSYSAPLEQNIPNEPMDSDF